MIHTDKTELFRLPVYSGTIYAARPANRAISNHYRSISDCIFYLVVVTDDLDGVGPGFSVDFNPDDELIAVDSITRNTGKVFNAGLIKHFISLKPEIEKEENKSIEYNDHGKQQLRQEL